MLMILNGEWIHRLFTKCKALLEFVEFCLVKTKISVTLIQCNLSVSVIKTKQFLRNNESFLDVYLS